MVFLLINLRFKNSIINFNQLFMNSFFLYVPINRTLIACFLGLTVGILYFCNLFEKCGYKSRPLHRWIGILLLTFLVSIPNEYFISASDVLIKKL